MIDATRDMLAQAIHESNPIHTLTPWDDLPPSPLNPQRAAALAAADAVIALYSPVNRCAVEVGENMLRALAASDRQKPVDPQTPLSAVAATVIPEGLCGAVWWVPGTGKQEHCVFTPHAEGTKHSWQQ